MRECIKLSGFLFLPPSLFFFCFLKNTLIFFPIEFKYGNIRVRERKREREKERKREREKERKRETEEDRREVGRKRE